MSSLTLPLPGTPRGAAFGQIVLNEARLTWRRPVVLVAGVGIPVLLLVIFGELPSFHQATAALGGYTAFDLYVPVLIAFSLAMLALLGLPMPIASYRELGVLRRLSTTPVPPSWLLAAQGVVQLCIALASLVIIFVTSVAAFGAPDPAYPARALFYVGVPDVETALQQAERLGGQRRMGPERAPTGLVVGHFTDPEGNLIGVAGPA
jgi:hypothetical protein